LQKWLYARNQNPPTWASARFEEVNILKSKAGYIKITNACRLASLGGYDWIWVDTVCIDKKSSAELSEAINSMFNWYANAVVCYAFLADVPDLDPKACRALDSPFRKSRWFERGWTLQELIAPKRLEFYSQHWITIGSKKDLSDLIKEITKVPQVCLENSKFLPYSTIAEKMSWASGRETSRTEDMAYCLLGIFDVRMPPLYGEGGKNAFIRLQEEIMKESTDHSLFAWRRSPLRDHQQQPTVDPLAWGILATHPWQFKHTASVRNLRALRDPYSMTSRGIRVQLPLLEWGENAVALLDCALDGWSKQPLGIRVSRTGVDFGDGGLYVRTPEWNVYLVSSEQAEHAQIRTVYFLKQDLYHPLELPTEPERTGDKWLEQAIDRIGTFPDLSMIYPGPLGEGSSG